MTPIFLCILRFPFNNACNRISFSLSTFSVDATCVPEKLHVAQYWRVSTKALLLRNHTLGGIQRSTYPNRRIPPPP